VFGIEHELELYTIFCFFCRRAASSNKTLQGTGGQRGFPEFSLAANVSGKSKFSAINPAGP
jgi:hypothetical protein